MIAKTKERQIEKKCPTYNIVNFAGGYHNYSFSKYHPLVSELNLDVLFCWRRKL